ncbi:hypothetical protein AVEN_18665-1 [Araneus ventricosus]|uniref:Uncharacterized protein n=1 Tax=Araneus ventricosus TaxID=182803 RepID=A0A4Y2NTI9_ARAVE|nr:hypothetical protein AVEN_18665-1 [Araneus ventricosus]
MIFSKTTLEGSLQNIQHPGYLKNKLHVSIQLWRNEWDNGDNVRNVHLVLPKVKEHTVARPEVVMRMCCSARLSERHWFGLEASWLAASSLQAHFVSPGPQRLEVSGRALSNH